MSSRRREDLIKAYSHELPDSIPNGNTGNIIVRCPTDRYFGSETTGKDAFGVQWLRTDPNNIWSGMCPDPTAPPMLSDIKYWREIEFPDLADIDWETIVINQLKNVNRDEVVITALISSGLFERLNQLMGMENALCSILEEPYEVKEFFAALADFKLECIDACAKYIKPDIIQMHDDWGTERNMFFSPDIWREFIKPHEARFAKRIHEHGMFYEHHSCGYITPIVGDLVEIEVDAINPLNVCNDLEMIKSYYGRYLTLVGGYDNQAIEAAGLSGDNLALEIKRTIDLLAPGGNFVSYFVPLNDHTWREVSDIADYYGEMYYKKSNRNTIGYNCNL